MILPHLPLSFTLIIGIPGEANNDWRKREQSTRSKLQGDPGPPGCDSVFCSSLVSDKYYFYFGIKKYFILDVFHFVVWWRR